MDRPSWPSLCRNAATILIVYERLPQLPSGNSVAQ